MKTCEHCGEGYSKPKKLAYWQFEQQRFCSRRCRGQAEKTRTPNDQFKARYRQIKTPDGRRLLEHRWVMEQHLGRPLRRSEQVHHINHDRLDNQIDNLELVSSAEHAMRHTWRPVTATCAICAEQFTPHKTKRGRVKTCGRRCGALLTWQTRRGAK
jgi:hypothetical protein